jgi:hypothetical protein
MPFLAADNGPRKSRFPAAPLDANANGPRRLTRSPDERTLRIALASSVVCTARITPMMGAQFVEAAMWILQTEVDREARAWIAAFRQELQKFGWTEDRSIRIQDRSRLLSPDRRSRRVVGIRRRAIPRRHHTIPAPEQGRECELR